MPWSAGAFTRTNGVNSGADTWAQDKAASTKILASRADTHDQDLATGINNCIAKDGQNAATANLPMGGFKHTNVASASADNQYASYGQVKTNFARIYERITADTDVNTTTSETTLFTSNIVGGDLGTARGARLTLIGFINQNTGSDKTFQFRLKFGATTLHDYTYTAVSNSSSRLLRIIFEVYNDGTNGAQISHAEISIGAASAGTSGISTKTEVANYNASSENTAVDKTLVVTVQHNDVGCQTLNKYSFVEIV